MPRTYDAFLSYAHADRVEAEALRAALERRGLDIWLDGTELQTFESITRAIERGLRHAKALVALYSTSYPTRRACQWELTWAFLAAQRHGDPRERVLVVNPVEGVDHIEPVELRDALFARLSATETVDAVAARVAEHVAKLAEPLGDLGAGDAVPWYGRRPLSATRFVGRVSDMWRIHSSLQAGEVSLITGTAGAGLAQVVGLAGIGKSLLAAEYALRFGSAYPGGVYWLRAHGYDDVPTAEARVAERDAQMQAFAIAKGIKTEGLGPAQVHAALASALDAAGRPHLWIVDDLEAGLARDEIDAWMCPSSTGKTLVTTRSREYSAVGAQVDLGVLAEADGLALLQTHLPIAAEDLAEARRLVADLGGHALALEVAGAALAAERGVRTIAQYRSSLADPQPDELEIAGQLADELPTGHNRSIAGTLLRSIRTLDDAALDLLRLAAILAVEPIPAELVVETFRIADGLEPDAARRRAVGGMQQAHSRSLAEIAGESGADRVVHALVSRTVRGAALPTEREGILRRAVSAALCTSLAPVRARQPVSPTLVAHARHVAEPLGDLWALVLQHWVSHCDYERGDPASARALQEGVIAAAERFGAEADHIASAAMSSLSGTLAMLGDRAAALTAAQGALALARGRDEIEQTDLLTLTNNVAEAHWAVGDFERARSLHEEVLRDRLTLLGPEHPQTLTSANNLASTLGDLGELEDARRGLEDVIAARRRVLGDQHLDTLSSMNNLGIVLAKLERHAEAAVLYRTVLAGRYAAVGGRHPFTLTALHNFGSALAYVGELPTSLRLMRDTLQLRVEVLGSRHPDTLTSMNTYASLLARSGNLANAWEWHERVHQLRLEVLGAEDPETIASARNAAATRQLLELMGQAPDDALSEPSS
jgi:tetratricopeptide (TPR) repeat protein